MPLSVVVAYTERDLSEVESHRKWFRKSKTTKTNILKKKKNSIYKNEK